MILVIIIIQLHGFYIILHCIICEQRKKYLFMYIDILVMWEIFKYVLQVVIV